MFDYTKAALDKIIADFKKFIFIFSVVTQACTIAYLFYSVLAGNGPLWANIPLLILSAAYLTFFIVLSRKQTDKATRKLKAKVKRIFTRSKLFIRFFTVAVLVYGVFTTAGNFQPLSVILLAFTLVGWVLQVLFELVTSIVESRVGLFMEALKADWEEATAPVRKAGNFFKRLAGKEVEEKPEPTKTRAMLDRQVEERREQRREEKREKKLQKIQEKARLKAELAAAKHEKRKGKKDEE